MSEPSPVAAALTKHRFIYRTSDPEDLTWFCAECPAMGVGWGQWVEHADAMIAEELDLQQEWGATCDRWSGGRFVRGTREEAWNDAVTATERGRGAYSSLEPSPPAMDDMRIESRWVTGWKKAEPEPPQCDGKCATDECVYPCDDDDEDEALLRKRVI